MLLAAVYLIFQLTLVYLRVLALRSLGSPVVSSQELGEVTEGRGYLTAEDPLRAWLCHPVSDYLTKDLDPSQTMTVDQSPLSCLDEGMKGDTGKDGGEKEKQERGAMEVDTEALTEAATSSAVTRPRPQTSTKT
ncbi:hypothetical protein NP233_g10681 [Leucocoprinus birnbaumii]|uniref:Uncharacterized protein n=1 Tax=Leucocoprinus birnbaumii TaxID=56174 RepID=A0AAD5YL30_9AGAR|nr:hypothetical protein NP233_g10681 [Leucocoprinus birnbaumii]